MNAGGIFGRVAPAWLSDKIGRFNLLCPSAFLCGLTCLVFWMFGKDSVSIAVFAALYGLFSGALISVINPCVAQISDMREIGTRIGALYTLISVPCVSLRLLCLFATHLIRVFFSQFALWGSDRGSPDRTTTRRVHSQYSACRIEHDTWLRAIIDIEIDDRPAIPVSCLGRDTYASTNELDHATTTAVSFMFFSFTDWITSTYICVASM